MSRFLGIIVNDVWRLAEAISHSNKDGSISYSLNGVVGSAARGQWFDLTGYAKDDVSRIEMIIKKNISELRSVSSRKRLEREENSAVLAIQIENDQPEPSDDLDFLDDDECNCQVCRAMRGEDHLLQERINALSYRCSS